MIATAAGANVIAIDLNDERLALATEPWRGRDDQRRHAAMSSRA